MIFFPRNRSMQKSHRPLSQTENKYTWSAWTDMIDATNYRTFTFGSDSVYLLCHALEYFVNRFCSLQNGWPMTMNAQPVQNMHRHWCNWCAHFNLIYAQNKISILIQIWLTLLNGFSNYCCCCFHFRLLGLVWWRTGNHLNLEKS